MTFDSILIVTYGRTGSTLLMGLLNTIPGVLIRGENMNICFGLYKSWQSIRETQKHDSTRESTHPFFGGLELDEKGFIQDARGLLRKQLVPASMINVRCWGFKELRYLSGSLGGTSRLGLYLDFLNILMPNPAFLVLTRNHADVLDSGFWKDEWKNETDKNRIHRRISNFEEEAFAWMKSHRNAFHIDYKDIVANGGRLKELYTFLGADYCEEAVMRILEIPHSYELKQNRINPKPGLNLEYQTADDRAIVSVDDDVLTPSNVQDAVSLRGVVVVQDSRDEQLALLSVDAVGEHPVKWGIESPKFALKFPDNPNARRARFNVDGLRISPQRPIELYLVDGGGNRNLLCRLTMSVAVT